MEKPVTQIPEVAELEAQAKRVGVDFRAALGRAKVAQTTIWRWSAGRTDPDTKTLRRIKSAISELQAEAT